MFDKKGATRYMGKISKAVLKCQQIMDYLIENGFTKQVTKKQLKTAIIRFAGLDPRTFKKYIEALELLGYIEKIGNGIYQIAHTRIGKGELKEYEVLLR